MFDTDALDLILSEDNRILEEKYARELSDNNKVNLFFILENKAFTDGNNIVVDPSADDLYMKTNIIKKAEEKLGITRTIVNNCFTILKVISRGFIIHEALHIVYSDFPDEVINNERGSTENRKKVLLMLSNIIEDGYIENAGVSEFKNIEYYLKMLRTSLSLLIDNDKNNFNSYTALDIYFNYVCKETLFGGANYIIVHKKIWKCIKETIDIIKRAQIEINIKGRKEAVYKVFDIIEELITEEPWDESKISNLILNNNITRCRTSINNITQKGRTPKITRRLFEDLDGRKVDLNKGSIEEIIELIDDEEDSIRLSVGSIKFISAKEVKASNVHKGIKILIERPKVDLRNKVIYNRIISENKIAINNYSSKCRKLLEGEEIDKEEKQLFGSGINATRLGDVNKRYWYKNKTINKEVSCSFIILIDGSGSMYGSKNRQAIKSSIIIHEVLKKNNIEHAIVEERAVFDEPIVKHKILVDFKEKRNEKYNLVNLKAEHGTREGLSLLWVNDYLNKNSTAKEKVIIVISDGLPYHYIGGEDITYEPPLSMIDTKDTVNRISKMGTKVIAIALEED